LPLQTCPPLAGADKLPFPKGGERRNRRKDSGVFKRMNVSKKKSRSRGKKRLTEKGRPSKKHPCSDCNFCQFCNDEKCAICRPSTCIRDTKPKKKEHKPLFLRY